MSLISRLPLYMLTVCVVYLSLLSVSLFITIALPAAALLRAAKND
jgi:hypothetical protein